ncbi:MAG: sugar ABC transporter permease [Clostridia bacterium]|nr:sugar ABC transporter permease [Clostridia bacterium]
MRSAPGPAFLYEGGAQGVSVARTIQPDLRKKRINWQKVAVIVLFAAVPLFLLILFTYIPFGKMIQFSFYNMSYTKNKGFVGLDNYLKIFTKSEYVDAMLLSLYYMAGAVVQLALALFFASVLSLERIRGSGVFKAVLFFPFLVNGIAIGYIFKYFYTRGFVLDTVLQAIGIPLESLPYWLRDQNINNWSLVFTSLWKYCGQNMVLFIGAIASIDPTLYEAATIDGANRWQQFKAIILPGIKTVFMLNLILSITGSLSAFEPAYVVGSMGANGTATFFIKIHQMAHVSQKVGQACAMAMVLMALILIFTVAQRLFFRYVMKDSESTFNAKANKAKALW